MKAKPIPDSIGQVLEVDELCESGLRWKHNNKPAGSKHYAGYFEVGHKGKRYLAHRVIWLLITGADPGEYQIDHKDGNRANNKFENLRLATSSQNLSNRGKLKNNAGNYKGVTRHRFGYVSQIRVNRKQIHIGTFKTEEEAAEAYNQAAIKHHGEYAKLNVIEAKDEKR